MANWDRCVKRQVLPQPCQVPDRLVEAYLRRRVGGNMFFASTGWPLTGCPGGKRRRPGSNGLIRRRRNEVGLTARLIRLASAKATLQH
jgi:hypothetical protein